MLLFELKSSKSFNFYLFEFYTSWLYYINSENVMKIHHIYCERFLHGNFSFSTFFN